MKWIALLLAAALPLGATGCMNDQTKRMAESCQDWLQRPDKLGLKSFIQDADKQIAVFDVPETAADSNLVFKLTVTDDKGDTGDDDVTVKIEPIA